MSGADLAKLAGIKQPSLWDMENAETKSIKADTLMRVAHALEVNPAYLWNGRGSPAIQIDPNDEEAEIVALNRRLTREHRAALLEMGRLLLKAQPATAPWRADPFPGVRVKARKL